MTTKNENITFAIRSIRALLKSKLDDARLTKYINSYNNRIRAKIKEQNPNLDLFQIYQLAKNKYMPSVEWHDGMIGLKHNFFHHTHCHKVKIGYTCDFSMEWYITALHIAYLKLRNSSKQHTGDDDVWIQNNAFHYKELAKFLVEKFEIPEAALFGKKGGTYAS